MDMMKSTQAPDKAPGGASPKEAAEGVAAFDVAAVNTPAARQLYKAREPIYPKRVFGPFRSFKWFMLFFCLGVYYLLPWVRWPRGPGLPDQAVLVDFTGGRFYFFFIELWPQELYFLTGLLIMAGLSLFLVTSVFGRVWCGYACPQTIWTDLFITVERVVEGDRNARIKLAKAPMSVSKAAKKITKHAIWLMIGAMTGGAWILYFHDAPSVMRDFFAGQAPGSAYLFFGLLTFTTYTLAGTMREQVCTYMCPWPRIQGAMTDGDTLEVTYRYDRGEPRGAHKKGDPWEGRGDCIDCRACVVACPMGIDIRDGDQLECINCALCIDACNDIMVKIDRPKGLIAYDTQANLQARIAGVRERFRLIRPRTVFYTVALTIVSALMLFGLSTRSTLSVTALADRNPAFVRLSDGAVRNGYELKITNKAHEEREFAVVLDGPDSLSVRVLGAPEGTGDEPPTVSAPADGVETYRLFVTAPPGAFDEAAIPFTFRAVEIDGLGGSAQARASFQTGVRR
jgi:cytochrome c oxidase accessory protein FixG